MNQPTDRLMELVESAGLARAEHDQRGSLVAASAAEYRFEPLRTVAMLAGCLEELHGLDIDAVAGRSGSRTATLGSVVALASARTEADPHAGVDPAYAHMTRRDLLAVLSSGADRIGEVAEGDLVLTHGAPDLDALLCDDGTAVGFADWGAVALADRHRDLAYAAASLAATLGPAIVPEFFSHYGPRPVPARLDWWLLAQQLLGPPEHRDRAGFQP